MSGPPLQSGRDVEGIPASTAADWTSLNLDSPYVISRFTVLRAAPSGLIAESPVSGASLSLSNSSQSKLFLAFVRPISPATILRSVGTDKSQAAQRFIERCVARRLVTRLGPDGTSDEDRALGYWEPHDLYFHFRTRRGNHQHPMGATFHRSELALVPAVKLEQPTHVVPLDQPLPGIAIDCDRSLADVLENRRSRYSVAPVDGDSLGRFLYRTCRVTGTDDLPGVGRILRKVYPSGGSLHSLEVYVIANRCPGVERGVYRYRSLQHDLVPICGVTDDANALLIEAQRGTGDQLSDLPSVLFIIATRFGRVSRKYQSLAYSAVLKEVGVLFQTMYLVATAMSLAPCAIGTGNSELFSRVAGTGTFEEVSVGEFIVGGAA